MPLALLNKLDIKVILAMLCAILALGLCFFIWQNSSLKQDLLLKDLELQQANLNLKELNLALEKQNQALESLRVQKTQKDTSAVDKIVIQDSSCEAELRGYKDLFKELGK
ncbi:hypothetical protein [uncultured Helicobacter sp.]|uniref:hypothetical protein n=1 Tax=uncultured Helicobacter sp. TaxID=175537 RepID=UPI00261E579B|nr:hypothetical protein [uncultured Helicobacter sp.]